MYNTENLKGILPAVVTPVDENEIFAPAAYEALLEKIYTAGVDGIYVCGQTGEGPLQTVNQRKKVAEASVACSPKGKQVIVHVGSHRTEDAVDLARHASRIGATAVSALPPGGVYPFAEILAYYREIARACTVPFLVYYFPDTCPAIKTAEQILDLCAIPGVVGLKFTDFDLYRMRILKQHDVVLYNGRDEILVAGLLMGADGGIGTFYNVLPDLFVDLFKRTQQNDWTGARAVQDRINKIIEITLRFPALPAVKQTLRWMGIACGECIRPRQRLTEEQARDLKIQLTGAGLDLGKE